MVCSRAPTIEPFAELSERASRLGGNVTYRLGYRLKGAETVVASIDMPAEIVEQIVLSNMSLATGVSPSGDVRPEISGLNCIGDAATTIDLRQSIDDIVRTAMNTENLRMEETNIADLEMFLNRLERSVVLVKEAIERMSSRLSDDA